MIRWSKGGEGAVLRADDDRVTVRSTAPAAPGSRLEGALPSGSAVRLKVARCRADGGAFVIEGKLLDATRAVRDEVAELTLGLRSAPAMDEDPPR
jgi:hypothetical protein